MNTTLVQVLGAVAYGELKAYENAKVHAETAQDDDSRRRYRKVAAEELRHYKGFVRRLEALGADSGRAMRPYRAALDRYHSHQPSDPVTAGVFEFLGEGIADDLLRWLQKVVDPDTATFIGTVLADEIEHEASAATELRSSLEATSGARRQAARAAQQMVIRMLWSGRDRAVPFAAFVRLGRTSDLLCAIAGGHIRRMRSIGLGPLGLPIPPRTSAPVT